MAAEQVMAVQPVHLLRFELKPADLARRRCDRAVCRELEVVAVDGQTVGGDDEFQFVAAVLLHPIAQKAGAVANAELAAGIQIDAPGGVVRRRLYPGIDGVRGDVEAADVRPEGHQIADGDLLRRNRLGRDDAAVQAVVLGLFRGDRHAVRVQLVVKAVLPLHHQLVRHHGAALDQVALDGHAHQLAGDRGSVDRQILDDAGGGIEVLNGRLVNVGEVNIRILHFRVLDRQLVRVQLVDAGRRGGQIRNVRLLCGQLRQFRILCLQLIDPCRCRRHMLRFQLPDKGKLGIPALHGTGQRPRCRSAGAVLMAGIGAQSHL